MNFDYFCLGKSHFHIFVCNITILHRKKPQKLSKNLKKKVQFLSFDLNRKYIMNLCKLNFKQIFRYKIYINLKPVKTSVVKPSKKIHNCRKQSCSAVELLEKKTHKLLLHYKIDRKG